MKRSHEVYDYDIEPQIPVKKRICVDLSEYDTDEEFIPIKYQGEWKIAGGKYKMIDQERKELKRLLAEQARQEKTELAVVLYTPLNLMQNLVIPKEA